MKVTTVSCGTVVKVYLIPENDLEKAALKQIQGGSAEVVAGISTLETVPLNDALVITSKIHPDEKTTSTTTVGHNSTEH